MSETGSPNATVTGGNNSQSFTESIAQRIRADYFAPTLNDVGRPLFTNVMIAFSLCFIALSVVLMLFESPVLKILFFIITCAVGVSILIDVTVLMIGRIWVAATSIDS